MKKIILLAFILMFSVSFGQVTKTIFNVEITDTKFLVSTAKNGDVECTLSYETTTEGQNISNENLRTLLLSANELVKMRLKSSRSFVPLHYVVKYKYKANGNHKYAVHVKYAATNSYGGEVEGFEMIEFNKNFAETVGSALMRSQVQQ